MKRPDGVSSLEQRRPTATCETTEVLNQKPRTLLPDSRRLQRIILAEFEFAVVVAAFVGSARGSRNDVVPFANVGLQRQSFNVVYWALLEGLERGAGVGGII